MLEPLVDQEMVAVLALAYLVGMDEANKCAMGPRHVDQLLSAIRAAVDGKDFAGVSWSLWKLLMGLARLAANDSNKQHLFRQGAVALLASILTSAKPSDDKVLQYASETLLQLSFAPECATQCSEQLLARCRTLSRSSSCPQASRNLSSFLFQLRGTTAAGTKGGKRSGGGEKLRGAAAAPAKEKQKKKGKKKKKKKEETKAKEAKKSNKNQRQRRKESDMSPPPAAAAPPAFAAPAPAQSKMSSSRDELADLEEEEEFR